MIHEIYPHKFENAFQPREPQPEDLALFYQNNQALIKKQGDELVLPRFCDLAGDFSDKSEYLFSIDHSGFFLIHSASVPTAENLGLYPLIEFRTMPCQWMAFGGITGCLLYTSRKIPPLPLYPLFKMIVSYLFSCVRYLQAL